MRRNTIPYPLRLTTERLLIRSPLVDDAAGMREAIEESIDSLAPWLPWADHVPTLEEAELNCARAVERFRSGEDYRLHFFLKQTGLFLGSSGLHRADWSLPKFEIGYWVRRSRAGNGYVTEAVGEVTRFALEDLGALRVEIRASSLNVRSWLVAERLGFTLEGVLRNDDRHVDGSLRDTRVYARIASHSRE